MADDDMRQPLKRAEQAGRVRERIRRARRYNTQTFRLTPIARALIAALAVSPPLIAQTLPTGEQLVAGSATVSRPSASSLIVDQTSSKAILDWQSFSIGAGAAVRFNQPAASSVALNRVLGNDVSAIHGQLSANGQVFLVNPNGILFGANARVDVGGLVASTLNISNADFLNGHYRFERNGASGRIDNQGSLNAGPGGYVALIAPQIANDGTVSTPGGTAALAAGERVTLDLEGDGLMRLSVDGATMDTLIENRQAVLADGGRIILSARAADALTSSVVNNTGLIRAATLTERNGEIVLESASVAQQGVVQAGGGRVEVRADSFYLDGLVDVSRPGGQGGDIAIYTTRRHEGMAGGLVDASGREGGSIRIEGGAGMVGTSSTLLARGETQGGTIEMTANGVYLLNATLDASAAGPGGTVHVGGGWQGSGDLPHAREVFVGLGTEVRADGSQGGEAVLWSTDRTWHYGTVSAQGNGSAGGRIEVSSQGQLTLNGALDAGPGGSVLLDPKNIIVTDTPPDGLTWAMKLASGSLGGNMPALANEDRFGDAVALDGDRLAVGVSLDDTGGTNRGAVHLFTGVGVDFSGLTWQKKLASGIGANSMPALAGGVHFGYAVALNGDHLAVVVLSTSRVATVAVRCTCLPGWVQISRGLPGRRSWPPARARPTCPR